MRTIGIEIMKIFGVIALMCGWFVGASVKFVASSNGSAEEMAVLTIMSAFLILVGTVATYIGIWKETSIEVEGRI